MIVMGIESTAHTFGVGITDGRRILVNEKDTYKPERGGIIPREAADHHYRAAPDVIRSALDKAGVKMGDIDMFGFSQGPGIYAPLKVSFQISRFLSKKFKKKMIGVNHCIAHLEIARKETGFDDPVMLYASGGNTQIITFAGGYYRVFGETQDIGVGNLFDKFGRTLGLPFPAGPKIEQYGREGKKYIPMPYSIKGMDVSLSGIETFISNIKDRYNVKDLSFSLQETVFSMLIEASERAIAYSEKGSFVITGGVAANRRLNQMGREMADARGVKFKRIPVEYTGDNGAMIAYTAYLMRGEEEKDCLPRPAFRTDSARISYR